MTALTWKEKLQNELTRLYGSKKGLSLSKKFSTAFSSSYQDDYPVIQALMDIQRIETLTDTNPIIVTFYFSAEKNENILHLRVFQWKNPIPLSDILPILENFNLRTENERPHRVMLGTTAVWISDFVVVYTQTHFTLDKSEDLFQEAFANVYLGL